MSRTIAATTRFQEGNRQSDQELDRRPSSHESVRQAYGTIVALHPDGKPVVRVVTDQGTKLASDDFIPLNHSVSDIIERWGKLRTGMRVQVTYMGPDGLAANATIIGISGDREGEGIQLENDIEEPLWEVFTPGSLPV